MLASVEKLISAYRNGKKKMKAGNHRLEVDNEGVARFYYHWTAICTVNPNKGTVVYDYNNFHTSSTTRSINSYREFFGEGVTIN